MKTVKIDNNTCLIDARDDYNHEKIREEAEQTLNAKTQRVGNGFFLAGNMINYYHVASVCHGLVTASFDKEMTPSQTRPIVREYLERTKCHTTE